MLPVDRERKKDGRRLDRFYVIICINAIQLQVQFISHFLPVSSGFHFRTHTHSIHFSVFSLHNPPPSVTSHQHAPHHGYKAVARQCGAGSHLLRTNLHALPTKYVEKLGKLKYCGFIHTIRPPPDQGGDVWKFLLYRFINVDLYKFHTNKQTFIFIYKIPPYLYITLEILI